MMPAFGKGDLIMTLRYLGLVAVFVLISVGGAQAYTTVTHNNGYTTVTTTYSSTKTVNGTTQTVDKTRTVTFPGYNYPGVVQHQTAINVSISSSGGVQTITQNQSITILGH